MKRMLFIALSVAILATGCRSSECQQMSACCDEVEDAEWSGDACGEMAESVRDAETCRTILETIRMTLQSREEPVPEPCQ